MTGRRLGIAALSGVVALALGGALASAAQVGNGNFENGNLSGWEKDFYPNPADPSGAWFVYEGPFEEPPPIPIRRGTILVPAPPQGDFGAITDQGDVSGQILSQVVDLKAGKRHKLRFKLAYANQNTGKARGTANPGFFTPDTLGLGVNRNQQFRMDVMKPDAPIKSVKTKHVLERVYITERGDPNKRGFRTISANLTPYAGDKVRLRFAVVVTEAPLNVGIDAVKVKTKPAN